MQIRLVLFFLFLFLSSLLFLFYGFPPLKVISLVRLPELLISFSFGSVLALSGGVFQNALRNPLAEPYTLGVSSAAALGAVLSLLCHFRPEVGALLLSLFLVFLLWLLREVFKDSYSLLLLGVGLNAFLSALILFVYSLIPSYTLTDAIYFTLGFITPAPLPLSFLFFLISLLTLLLSLFFLREISLLPLGSEMAYFSGIDREREAFKLLVLFSIPVALFVSNFGVIGFLGMVVPHGVRLLGLRVGAPFVLSTFLSGGALLIISQFLAKELLYPTILPAGVITALFGAPSFIYLLWRYSVGRG
ncbi:FecCD family ABC transporter permease [Thermovibrio sp.]